MQAQQKNAKKMEAQNKKGSNLGEGASKMKGAQVCPICKSQMVNYKMLQQHYESKHPKETCPPVESL